MSAMSKTFRLSRPRLVLALAAALILAAADALAAEAPRAAIAADAPGPAEEIAANQAISLGISTTQPSTDAAPAVGGLLDSPVVTDGLDPDGKLRLSINHSRTLVTAARLRNADHDGAAVTAGSADVITVDPMSPNSILITAKKAGSTNIVLEDELGRRQAIDVIVDSDLGALKAQLIELNPQATIDVSDDNGSMVLSGHVPSLKVADEATQIAGAWAGAGKVVNLLEISGGQQVMLQVKFAEVSKSVQTQLGVNFGYSDGETYFGNNIGQVNPFVLSGSNLQASALSAVSPGAAVQFFGNANFGRSAMAYFINCLRTNQLMRTLAEPNLTTVSGEQASFQVGGEIPIPVPQQGGGGGTSGSVVTIQYENYGVILHFTPVVLGDGRIRLKIDPEVSDLDYAHGVTIGGFAIPGFTTRTVDTTVELADGQTFTIAGLLNDQVTSTANTTPLLGDLPVLGSLFRSVEYQRNQTELVVMVTPRLVEAINPSQVTAGPGEHWRYPTEADLFLARDLGGEAEPAPAAAAAQASGPPPQFRGQYGFAPTPNTFAGEP
jgi:pilus assembly protein CpaC